MQQQRYLSLDVFRGMDVALMIIVNSLGSFDTAWSPLLHASWHGFTLTDLVFPTFLFVIGNAMFFSMQKYEAQGTGVVLSKVLKRTFIIFLIGYLLYWFPFFSITETGEYVFRPIGQTRILGVLQRIALCYAIAALIIHFFKVKGAVWYMGLSLAFYTWVSWAFGDLTMEGNAGHKLDMFILGADHLYQGEGKPFDPEGILSTIPSVVNVLAGYLTARFISRNGNGYETIARLMIAGAVLLLAAQWADLFVPINKKLWTASYVFQTIGLDLLILPIIMFVIEHVGEKRWTPFFEVFGKNTLVIYILSEVLVIMMYWIPNGAYWPVPGKVQPESVLSWLYDNLFRWTGDYTGSFLFGVAVMLTCWLVGYVLHRRKIYIKV
ncbi:MAG: acyltransferase family protein [Cyclobacteriaceae bacterium]